MSDERSPSEKVWMEHPELGPDRKQQVSLKQLENVWRLSGWFETEAPPPPPKKEKVPPKAASTGTSRKKPAAKKAPAKKKAAAKKKDE